MKKKPVLKTLNLEHQPTIWELMKDPAFVRIIVGPLGSGKTTGVAAHVMAMSMLQEPGDGNMRWCKGMVVRNTFPELKSTTVKTWLSMFPEAICGHFKHQPPFEHHIRIPPGNDGTPGLDLLVEFVAMDRPKDVRKLLSWEGSWIWFNEIREIERPIFNQATGRVGRYPSIQQGGVFCTRKSIIGDTNAFDADHYIYEMMNDAPEGYSFHVQPPAIFSLEEATKKGMVFGLDDIVRGGGKEWIINPEAENLANLDNVQGGVKLGTYYKDQIPGKPLDWLESYLQVKFVFVSDGRPCVPAYNDQLMSFADLPVLEDQDLLVGIDAGGGTLEPAAIIGQKHPRGNWLIHDEICAKDMGIKNFIALLNHKLATDFKGRKIKLGWGDPAGNARDEIFEVSILQHFRSNNIPLVAAPSNEIKMRIQAWTAACERMIDGKPGLMISKKAKRLRKGLSGKWMFKKKQISGTEQFHLTPDKNEYSHPCDAGGYMLLGGGEHQTIKGREQSKQRNKPHNATVEFDIF